MQRILIAGCGYVGGRLGEQLARSGYRVFGLRRGEDALPPGVEPVRADLSRVETLVALPEGIDGVVYAAAPRVDRRGDRAELERAYRAAYVDGPSNLLRALREQGERPQRFVFCSSTAVYGQERGEWVDETSATRPRRWNGELLLSAESLLRASSDACVIARLGGIYGPSRTRLVDRVRRGEARLARTPHYTNRIHRDDAAALLAHLLFAELRYDLYLAVDDEPADESEVLRWLAKQVGKEEPPTALEGGEAGAPARPGKGRAGSKRCRNARILSEGFAFEFPSFREGYAALLSANAAG